MIDPYRMVVVNIFASIFLIFGLFTYRYIYPKKKFNLFAILILISLLPLISLLRRGVYESGDLTYHIKSSVIFSQSITEGSFIPKWSPTGCNGYGCPDFIFLYLIPYYLICFFHFIGFSFVAAIKVFISLTYILSGGAMYIWLKNEFNNKAAFVGSVIYLFAPYHLVDMHFRTAVGELACFALLPLALYFGSKLTFSSKPTYFIGLTLSIFALLLSHQALSLGSIPIVMIYIGIKWYQKKKRNISELFHYFFSIFIGIFLASFYWLPIFAEKEFITWGTGGQINLLKIQDLLYSPWRFGLLFQGHNGELSFLIGYIQIITIGLAIYFLFKKRISKIQRPLLIFFILLFFFLAFLMTTYSSYAWTHFSLLSFFGFSYRLSFFVCIIVSYFTATIVTSLKNDKITGLICAVAIFSTILNWGNRKVLPNINDAVLKNNINTENQGINPISLPIWVKGNYYYEKGRVKTHLDQIGKGAKIKELPRTTNHHEYLISVNKQTLLRENTFYFPGWNLYVNNKRYPFIYDFPIQSGTMYFILPKGTYDVEFKFEDVLIITIAKLISLFSLASFILIVILSQTKKK